VPNDLNPVPQDQKVEKVNSAEQDLAQEENKFASPEKNIQIPFLQPQNDE
jgi:hypothetical protein